MTTAIYHRFDRSLQPPAEQFFRQNVRKFRRYGRRAREVCPFHPRAEHQSFSMDLDKGLYHCFVCDASGDMVKFVMEKDGLHFMEAARQLGALAPVNDAQARKFHAEREAKVKAQQAQRQSWTRQLQGLLSDIELYESVRDYAFHHRDDRLHELAEEGITLIGQRYILAKLEAEHGAR